MATNTFGKSPPAGAKTSPFPQDPTDKGILGWDTKTGSSQTSPKLWFSGPSLERSRGKCPQPASPPPGRQAGPEISGCIRNSRQGSIPGPHSPGPGQGLSKCSQKHEARFSTPGSPGIFGGEQPDPLIGLLLCQESPKRISLHQRQSQHQISALRLF